MFTVLVTAPSLAAPGVSRLQGCRVLYAKDEAELGQVMAREPVDGVISRTMNLSGDAIRSCASLKAISKHGAGYNNIDVDAATRLGIPVFFTPGANAQAVAELTIGMMIAVARGLPNHDRTLHTGGWSRSTIGLELSGRTLGIVGLGQIGQRVARLAAAFGMKVLAVDPNARNSSCEMVNSLADLLPRADVLSMHCPLTAETKGMIGAAELAALPRDAIVINTARGGIVDEAALTEALSAKKLFGAALDSFDDEPLPAGHPFSRIPGILLTPHIGASTREALDAVAIMSAQNLMDFLAGVPVDPARCVNPTLLHQKATVSA